MPEELELELVLVPTKALLVVEETVVVVEGELLPILLIALLKPLSIEEMKPWLEVLLVEVMELVVL